MLWVLMASWFILMLFLPRLWWTHSVLETRSMLLSSTPCPTVRHPQNCLADRLKQKSYCYVGMNTCTLLLPVGGTLQEALTFGCKVAGRKCGFHGYDNIGECFGEKWMRKWWDLTTVDIRERERDQWKSERLFIDRFDWLQTEILLQWFFECNQNTSLLFFFLTNKINVLMTSLICKQLLVVTWLGKKHSLTWFRFLNLFCWADFYFLFLSF